jgi:diaminohydroxyphosphoribosylaminopyrimidine deaminase/5-amino-6-(5-phosphoribosylamino)uracil reductase
MREALRIAREGWGQVAPNPLVGAVMVKDNAEIARGYHARFGEAHAEVAALAKAGPRARGATLYVTLEPCGHVGKTPPCTDAIIGAGISRVVIATRDANPVAAGGAEKLVQSGIEVAFGVCEAEARELNATFLFAIHADRPWVTLKMAVTLDGAIADGTHTTSRVTGPDARRYAHALRAGHDAVGVGMHTVRTDDPRLTVREAPTPRVPPARVVFSRSGRLSLTSTLANSLRQGPVVVTANEIDPAYELSLADAGVEVVLGATLGDQLRALRSRGIQSLLIEGGANLAAALWREDLVDRLILVQAPTIFGAGALGAFSDFPAARGASATRWPVVSRVALGDDLATTYAIHDLPAP